MNPEVVEAAARFTGQSPPSDKLERVRAAVRDIRDKRVEALDLEARLAALKSEIYQKEHRELPDLFAEVGVDQVGLPAEGNLPAYDAKEGPYYHANIAADWVPERRAAAFQVLEDEGHGDLVKTVILVPFGRGEQSGARALREYLELTGRDFQESLAVPWNTLTALVQELHQKNRLFSTEQLEKIGATVGRIVKLKERKD